MPTYHQSQGAKPSLLLQHASSLVQALPYTYSDNIGVGPRISEFSPCPTAWLSSGQSASLAGELCVTYYHGLTKFQHTFFAANARGLCCA